MTNYIISETTHSTGEKFFDVEKVRDNAKVYLVEASSKEEALSIIKEGVEA